MSFEFISPCWGYQRAARPETKLAFDTSSVKCALCATITSCGSLREIKNHVITLSDLRLKARTDIALSEISQTLSVFLVLSGRRKVPDVAVSGGRRSEGNELA